MAVSIQFRELCAIPTVPGFSLVRSAVANDGSLLFLFAETATAESLAATYKRGIGVFPRTRTEIATGLCLVRMTSMASHTIELPELDLTFPQVDVFPDGRILVAGPRCAWRSNDDFDLNGAIILPETGAATRILLGDGISSMQIDSLGRIWVGYFDEGVFGNFGWGGRDGPPPVGCSGLACFSASGEKIWEFPGNPIYAISDCYALNVSGTDAAIFFYTDFPLCRISGNFELTYWKPKLAGCNAFAISETEVLFSGQYNDPADAAYVGRLASGGLGETKRVRLLMPDGSGRSGGQLLGRGNSLYHFDAEKVCRLSLD
ncbi:hypothetical protein [Bradyrhizobium sp. AUGA SZCCT0177]|uniref:hypothetical protein n=3 Tax=Bradyrhizobium TaxID=374 RepID=UPI002011E08D|nr:hypothetical protein [Bradyrhizobium sp. AUGA SZCCT0177]